jgi:hypothetical protein
VTTDGNGDWPDDPAWIKEPTAQRRGPSAAMPRGRAVSSALILPRGVLPRDLQLRNLLATIDSMHGDGELPRIPVRWGVLPRGMVAQYRMTWDSTEALSLTINPNRSRWLLATVHEIGHFLDHQGVGDATSMASRTSPLLREWRQAVAGSLAYRNLVGRLENPAYLTAIDELWARSYAQWIAMRSGDTTLRTQILDSRGSDPRAPIHMVQWDDDDFSAIGDEIARLFRRLQWTG